MDYESVAILRDHKIRSLEKILKEAVDRKYKISFYKGMQLAFESLVLLVLMLSVCLKSNLFSLIYLLFIARYLTGSNSKFRLLVHVTTYVALCFISQYLLYMLNLTSNTSPAPFPI